MSKLAKEGSAPIVFIWGQTTLAQLLFYCVKVQDFDFKIWVSAGKIFDGKRVAKTIVEQVNPDRSRDSGEYQTALGLFRISVDGKKFLLVLDNVWEEDQNSLEPLFVAVKGGAPRSKISK